MLHTAVDPKLLLLPVCLPGTNRFASPHKVRSYTASAAVPKLPDIRPSLFPNRNRKNQTIAMGKKYEQASRLAINFRSPRTHPRLLAVRTLQ